MLSMIMLSSIKYRLTQPLNRLENEELEKKEYLEGGVNIDNKNRFETPLKRIINEVIQTVKRLKKRTLKRNLVLKAVIFYLLGV